MRKIIELFSLAGLGSALWLNLGRDQTSNNPGFGLGSKGRRHAFFSENGGMIRDQNRNKCFGNLQLGRMGVQYRAPTV